MRYVTGTAMLFGWLLFQAMHVSEGVSAWAAEGPVESIAAAANDTVQEDFPAMCLDSDGTPWAVYIEYDNEADRLKLARKVGEKLEAVGTLAGPGIVHRPALACDGDGAIWAVWSELDDKNAWSLNARRVVDGKIDATVTSLETASGSAIFTDAATDRKGRVWVAWQSFRDALSDIHARYYDPAVKQWSDEIRVTTNPAGDWEPRLAFSNDDAAWIAFDSSRGDNFNVHLARVSLDGKVKITPLTNPPRYAGRASIAATSDGTGFWLAWEDGKQRWGKNSRGTTGTLGLNADKRIGTAYYDIASGKLTETTNVTPVIKTVGAPKPPAAGAKAKRQPKRKPAQAVVSLNLPEIMVDASGNPWLACRYIRGPHWKIALVKYDVSKKTWSEPTSLPQSSFSQDRRASSARGADGRLWLAWPSDLRVTKQPLKSGIYLAEIDAGASMPPSAVVAKKPTPLKTPEPRWGDDTPERARDDRHAWTPAGEEFKLYWGDFHRHTDISNCRTAQDGCIVEQFRYAYDMGGLDFLGTSDHTDIGKPYDPYEWWCNQKLADVFHSPDLFNAFYVYEREQRWPWGHRNVIFIERGGPIIYIKRELYKSMPWHAELPVGEGDAEITPKELWKLLRTNDMDVSIISHTGATGMGTDWDLYGEIDNAVENLVEIYQGARVSYEATDTPQPTVGFPKNRKLKGDAHGSVKVGQDFGQNNNGVYQNALRNGYKLGVFANSDHISTHTSFGGVYVKSFTREGILEGLNARRTIAATDKIFMEFSANDHLLGEVFETSDKPALKVLVRGTAPLRAVTIVRNEVNIRQFNPKGSELDVTFTDERPDTGENRYYVRVEQVDGNMGWTSPVWITYQEK